MRQNRAIKIVTIINFSLLFLFGCSDRMNSVDQDRSSGKIVGKITTLDGAPAGNARVKMTPADFLPDQKNTTGILSTTSDATGQYSFSVEKAGLYSINAEKNGLYSFQDSVYGSEKEQVEAGTGTLKTPGSISGIARLNAPDDNRSIIILVLGTTTYCQPSDTSGAFVINNLAEGVYRLKLLSSVRGYTVLDTTVTVTEGKQTILNTPLQLVRNGLPKVGTVKADFNKAMQIVTLTWPPIDTTNVQGLYVFRNTSVAGKPHMILKKTTTQFIDDIPDTSMVGDTLSYTVVAYGADDKIGPVGVPLKIRIDGGLSLLKTIPIDRYSIFPNGQFTNIIMNNNLDLFISDNEKILKIDSSGNVLAKYVDNNIAMGTLSLDKDGNCYYYNYNKNSLFRLSNKLELQKSYSHTISQSISIHPFDGRLMCISDAIQFQDTSRIWIFDSDLKITDSIIFTVPDYSLRLLNIRPGRCLFAMRSFKPESTVNLLIAANAEIQNGQMLNINQISDQFDKIVTGKLVRFGEHNFQKLKDREMVELIISTENENIIVFDNYSNAYVLNNEICLISRFKCGMGIPDFLWHITYNESGRLCYFGDRKELRIYEFR